MDGDFSVVKVMMHQGWCGPPSTDLVFHNFVLKGEFHFLFGPNALVEHLH